MASFAQRAGHHPGLDYNDDDLYKRPSPTARKQNTSAHRVREPQAALHVPKPRDYAPADTSNHVRTSSIQDRSPLQKLEGKLVDYSKEEKRARMEDAERRSRQRAGVDNSQQNPPDQKRFFSDGTRGPTDRPLPDDHVPRRTRTDASQRNRRSMADDGEARFRQASNALREHGTYQAPPHGVTAGHNGRYPESAAVMESKQSTHRHSKGDEYLVSPDTVRTSSNHGLNYQIPPRTVTARNARSKVESGFAVKAGHAAVQRKNSRANQPPVQTPSEWRQAGVARLELEDLAVEKAGARVRDNQRSSRTQAPNAYDGADGPGNYQPALYVRCGPLLRYKGLRRERRSRQDAGVVERELWRGSVMLVTQDQHSSYSAPVLRIFAQPADLLQIPRNTQNLPSDYDDPVAGEIKPSRTGQPLYVKPIEAIPPLVDLSQEQGDEGLFESYRSSDNKSRLRSKDGEKVNKFKEVKGARLHAERGLTFWRFNIEVELGVTQARIAYRINGGPATAFWVPARGSTMNIMFHSCNGFSLSVDSNSFSGPDPLWRDVLNSHAMKPYHVMIGGGDQVYNDRVMRDTNLFREWTQIKNPQHKHEAEFTKDMQNELENFYLDRYCMWFSQGLFGMANSQIAMINMWDDHDIIDGFGSYPDAFMRNKVFTGLGAVAFKYYLLFQHQSVPAETFSDESSWVLGASPGPYINQPSRNVFMFLGRRVAFLGIDCRTERRRDEILCQGTYDLIFNRCRAEIVKGETKHLLVLLTVPIAYPRLNFLENILTSRVMDPIKAIGRTGALGLGGVMNKFDGGVEILDDLDDHWTAKHHKQERNWFIQELQALAAEKSVRITILGGDVHLGAIGQFYTSKKLGHVPKDQDHRYMPNVVSSAIVNTPPPVMMADILNRRNKVHHLDDETDEDMIPMFEHDVDGKPRKNKTLLPHRNYCTIREYFPGSTPPHSPVEEGPPAPRRRSRDEESRRYPPGSMLRSRSPDTPGPSEEDYEDNLRKYPPGSMGRSRSLTRDSFRPRNLLRRLSGSRSRKESDQWDEEEQTKEPERRASIDAPPRRDDTGSYFPDGLTAANDEANADASTTRPTHTFRRRTTDPSDKSKFNRNKAREALHDPDEEHPDDINLEYGLDICLNMEVSQEDPAGITVPYRLLVPALSFAGQQDVNTTRFRTRRASLLDRIRGRERQGYYSSGSDSGSDSSSELAQIASPVQKNARPLSQYSQRANNRPLHPDDRLQFADQEQAPRRDSRIAGGAMDGTHDMKPARPQPAILRKKVPGFDHQQQPPPRQSHQQPYHQSSQQQQQQQPHQGSDDGYAPTEELYAPPEKRRLSFFGSLKRRFSERRRRDDEYSDTDGSGSYDSASASDGEQHQQENAPPLPSRSARWAGQFNGNNASPRIAKGQAGPDQQLGRGPRLRAGDGQGPRDDGRGPSAHHHHHDGQRHQHHHQQATRGTVATGPGRLDRPDHDAADLSFSDTESMDLDDRARVAHGGSTKVDRFFGVDAVGKDGREQQHHQHQQQQQYQQQEQGQGQGQFRDDGRPSRRESLKFWRR